MPTPPPTPKQSPAAPTETPATMPAVLTPPATPPPPSEPASVLTPPTSPSKTASKTSLPDTPPVTPKQSLTAPVATPRKPISWAEIASRPIVAPKPSRLPIPTAKPIPKCTKTAPNTCPPTPPKPTPKHQKPYLTIEDLFEMFAEKPKRRSLIHTKKTESPPKLSRQAKITTYFRPATNQNASISQGSKTPNPRSFHQRMPAESIRAKSLPPTFTKPAPENSIVSPYKMPSISDGIPFTPAPYPYKGHALNGGPNFCSQRIRPQQVSQSKAVDYQECEDSMHGSKARLFAGWYVGRKTSKTSPHTCRRCFRAFRSNNDLHGHLRCTHLEHRRRRSTEQIPPGQRQHQP
ncbi:hypothetical protein G7Y79_00046g081940 [Physcia stellaris]|nr:hypothetical protein G7Y79_00046g081940 [Physcia stellaris]